MTQSIGVSMLPLGISDQEIKQRVARVQDKLRESGFAAVICFGAHRDYWPGDIRYLSRWSCTDEETAYVFIPTEGSTTLVIDAEWDYDRALTEACADEVVLDPEPAHTLVRLVSAAAGSGDTVGIGGFEAFPAPVYTRLQTALPATQLTDCASLLDEIKLIKSRSELELLRAAARITDAGMAAGIAEVRPGVSEAEVAAKAEYSIRRTGAELSFVTVMGAGVRTAAATFFPQRRQMREGEYAILDCGARVEGYHGDMCRTVVVGGPSRRQRHVLETTAEAVRSAIDTARPGATVRDVHDAARSVVTAAGYEKSWWGYYMPHGFGTAQHEAPAGLRHGDMVLADGMVICVEPGILLAGEGAVILEQMVAVRATGPETMNELPLNLWENVT